MMRTIRGSFWKHPRLRGEDRVAKRVEAVIEETPPLTRGRLRLVGRASRRARNTPAYAGKTVMEGVFPPDRTQHPRLRGEDIPVPGDVPTIGETPPLTRGRPREISSVVQNVRNTPAYAGKTSPWDRAPRVCPKHPRLRGEDSPFEKGTESIKETPPLTRGRRAAAPAAVAADRNTPAYAGKTLFGLASGNGLGKHPRLRGEDRRD